ncbi:CRISPR system CASCADE complex protein CasB [delta proteobacterium NaphS2]|nr:CRISPR system CASCADE complex protein CasB [delta proteobacterium NaphS2]
MSESRFLKYAETSAIKNWHHWLEDHRGDRARLRRAERPEDALLTDAFFTFLKRMPEAWQGDIPLYVSAAVAGLLSHVKEDRQVPGRIYGTNAENGVPTSASFAEQMATPVRGDNPPVSELRFQQLQKSKTTDEFYRRMIKVIRLLNGQVNIASMTNDIIHWHREFDHQIDRKPANRLAVRWATDYFTGLQTKTKIKGESL